MGLAGPKQKQRLGYDPQNTSWSNDTSKFGYKMLEKMGWKEGKGLGANEDGAHEHVKVKFKQDALGVGADARSIDNWMENAFAFDDILKNLNAKQDDKTNTVRAQAVESTMNPKADEQLFGRKLVRKKFIRNKNVTNYDSQDIGMILGVKQSDSTTTSAPASTNASPVVSSSEQSDQESVPKSTDLKVVKEQKVSDYFASKLGSIFADSKLAYLRGKTTSTKRSRDEEDEDCRPSFSGLGSRPLTVSSTDQSNEEELSIQKDNEGSKKKKSKKKDDSSKKKKKKSKD